ncbi:hypothetical protein F2Q68_00006441 [Brassica cretica]|uniref:Zinc knuckle CX2CX4HX4C domain-containing protein n=1 Tax=Brassica cretica TaxID=69181 RepID=A0A8S9J4I2_BRACR|nr:hypothetical protein F2Q68_00006441 [Brassica cretica]
MTLTMKNNSGGDKIVNHVMRKLKPNRKREKEDFFKTDEEASCGNWGTPGEEVVVVETEEVAGVETEKPAGDEVAADANKENTAEVEEQKESEDKMIVVIDGAKELCFDATVDFKSGEFYEEEAPVLLKYEKLFGFRKLCFKLCHDEDHCPLNPKNPVKKKETKDESESKKEDRARSYKGVVINGDVSNQENLKDQRGYYGKGKGKMYEEPDTKWVKVPERVSKRPSSYRTSSRVEEERSRFRNSRWEQPRNQMQDDRNRYQRDARRARSHLDSERDKLEIGNLVIGLERTKELVGNGNDDLKNETMEFDGTGTHVEGKEEFICGVLSPRKNAPVKTGKRQGEGEGAKQTEDKGPSNPKPTSSKPFN